MAAIVFLGDCTTTTALAVAATWPVRSSQAVCVVESDPSGGSIAAWLDLAPTPSLSSAVTGLHASGFGAGGSGAATTKQMSSVVEPMIRRSESGVRSLAAPVRGREARSAVNEAGRALLPFFSAHGDVFLIDAGRFHPGAAHPAVAHASLCAFVHRQHSASARAAAVRLERLAESMAVLRDSGTATTLIVVGDEPFATEEIHDFVESEIGAASGVIAACGPWRLPDDPLSAAVLAGRGGVSAKRLSRLPLMRAAAKVASDLDGFIEEATVGGVGSADASRTFSAGDGGAARSAS